MRVGDWRPLRLNASASPRSARRVPEWLGSAGRPGTGTRSRRSCIWARFDASPLHCRAPSKPATDRRRRESCSRARNGVTSSCRRGVIVEAVVRSSMRGVRHLTSSTACARSRRFLLEYFEPADYRPAIRTTRPDRFIACTLSILRRLCSSSRSFPRRRQAARPSRQRRLLTGGSKERPSSPRTSLVPSLIGCSSRTTLAAIRVLEQGIASASVVDTAQ